MFADDTNLFFSGIKVDNLFPDINCERDKISLWFKANKLSLNLTKKMDNIAIERDNVSTFLGVLNDENLSLKQHINNVSTKISKSIGILYKSRGIVKQPLLKQLYFFFIQCHLNYKNIAWASTYKIKLGGLYRHQKHAARKSILRIDLPMPNHYFMT